MPLHIAVVLCLVDHNIVESLLPLLEYLGEAVEEVQREVNQVVEVEHKALLLLVEILDIALPIAILRYWERLAKADECALLLCIVGVDVVVDVVWRD